MAGSLALAVTLSWPFARGQGFLSTIALLALLCLVLGLGGYWPRGLAWGLAAVAALFLVRLQLDPLAVRPWTPVAAALLLFAAELGYWSFELDGSSTIATFGLPARLLEAALLAVAAGVLAELALDAAELTPVSGGWLLALGVVAAAALPALLLRLSRR